MQKNIQRLSALVFAAAAFGMLPGLASAQQFEVSVEGMTLMGDGCPADSSVMVTVTQASTTAPGEVLVAFPDDMAPFDVTGSDAQRACAVLIDISKTGPRAEFNVARGLVDTSFSGGEQGVLSVSSRIMVGRRASAPISVQLNENGIASSDDQPMGRAAASLDRINTRTDVVRTVRLGVELSAQTAEASAAATIRVFGVSLVFNVVEDAAG